LTTVNAFAKGGIAAGVALGAAVLAAASFELVTGAGAGWARIPAGLVVVAFAAVLGWTYTQADDAAPPKPKPAAKAKEPARPSTATGYGFAGAEDPEIEAIVVRTMNALPRQFQEQIENLAFVIEDVPPPGKNWLATYQGIPLTEKTVTRSWDWPHRITIYRVPLREIASGDAQKLDDEVAHTVRHELAHYFGISDERLVELGAY